MAQRPTFSVIAPAKDEEELIEEFHRRVAAALEPLGEPFEIIIVNDGSSDRTPAILRELNRRDPRFKSLTLSRSFGAEPAFTAGLDYAQGDAIILIDSDLQDPPEVIPELIAKWREGYELVYAVRASREGETWFKKTTAAAFYRLMDSITSVNVPLDTGTFRLMDRSVVQALSQMREHNRSMRLLTVWTGFNQTGVPFRRHARKAGSTKYPLRKMIRLTLDNVTSFSYVPLQLATYFGFVVAALSVLAMLAVVIGRLSGSQAFFGQATTLIMVLFLGGVQLIFLGIIGEYLGRIYDEVRRRPLYIVAREVGFDGQPQVEGRALAPAHDDEVAPGARSYRR
jgi:glycosyltransferase involved in cell wall biosynthesis